MIGVLLAAVGTYLLGVPWGGRVIDALLAAGIGKNIRAEEPDAHQGKAGTATMGGVLFLGALTVAALLFAVLGHAEVLLPLLATLLFGGLGAFDDLQGLQDTSGVGWLARRKIVAQWGLALALGVALHLASDGADLVLPLSGRAVTLGWWMVPVAAFLVVSFSNGVNFSDGMDGLAGGTCAAAYSAYAAIAAAQGQLGLALFAASMVGALLAFLWFNVHPARLFMGDTGAQALGAGLAALAVLTGQWLVLPIVGAVFVVEDMSVSAQVGWFKYTRRKYGEGRRILRMAPIHYHFELGGLSEVQVTLRFWIVGAVAALLGVALALWRP